MDRRFSRESSRELKGSITLQKKIVESQRPNRTEHVPDLTDFMNDMFFGAMNNEKKSYNLTGGQLDDDEEPSFDDSVRSISSRLTQEWLEEARRMVATSPSRCDSPSRLAGMPRYAAVPGRHSSASILDRRDPLSRSARRHRPVGVSGEILTKSVKHHWNNSEVTDNLPLSPSEPSPASQVQQWFSNFLKPSNPTPPPDSTDTNEYNFPPSAPFDPTGPTLPPRLSINRKSRFQTESPASAPQRIPIPPRRSFKPAPFPDNTQLLSPPKNLVESAHRLSISSSTCTPAESQVLSPPRNLTESVQRRSISRSTCSFEKPAPPKLNNANGRHKQENQEAQEHSLNAFLKVQKLKIEKILNEECNSKAKLILSGPSNSTSSMVAAICYAWLLQDRMTKSNGEEFIVVPVMNVRRGRMWKQKQAAWLFHHVGLDATSLPFADEVEFENLMMAGKLNILVVGQDVLKNDGEVGSQCTILTDNFCEDAYDLLQMPVIKKLLLAGILLDTKNLNASSKMSMTRDAEAVQLLLVGSAPNYRNALFDQLMQDQRDNTFFEALSHNYGRPPSEANKSNRDNGAQMEQKERERKSISVSNKCSNDTRNAKTNKDAPKSAKPNAVPAPKEAPAQAQAAPEAPRGKKKFSLAKWFGFGSK